ncbi:MAG: TlpA disulfide reductase family protein [Bacteroidota bacterium]
MRNLMLVFSLSILASSTGYTQSTAPVYTILQGKFPTDIEESTYHDGKGWKDLSLAEDGTFLDTLNISNPQYVHLSLDGYDTRIYLTSGDEVRVYIDSAISFEGSHAEINHFLYQEHLEDEARGEFEFKNHEMVFKKKEVAYVQYRDSIRTEKLSKLTKLPVGTEAFQDFHQQDIEYEYQYDVARYPKYYSYYFNDYEPTEIITSFYQNVSVDNEVHAQNYLDYRSLVGLILDKRIKELEDTTLSPLGADLYVLKEIQSPTLLHGRLKKALYNFTVNDEDMEGTRDRLLAVAKLDKTKDLIQEHYEVISQLKPGNAAPSFDFENYAGGKTTLADLKGKYLYIDVWATWCNPCLKELPYLEKIEEEFQDANIEFVSISLDDLWSQKTWRNMIKDRQMGGVQLLADNGWGSDFVKQYGLRGIPHFILLDDQGNIVSANVERPSDPKLKKRLQALKL